MYKEKDMAKSMIYNTLLHKIRKLKSLYILNDFYKTLSSTKDLKVALKGYHDTLFKDKKYYIDLIEKNKKTDTTESDNKEIDMDELTFAIKKDLYPNYNNNYPFYIVDYDPARHLKEFLKKYEKPDLNKKYNLNKSWRVITSLFDEQSMNPNESKYWHSMLEVEGYLSSNGNPFVLGQFLWFEIILKNYNKFFVEGKRKLYTWGEILLADDKARFNLLDHICGTVYSLKDTTLPRILKAMNHKGLVDIHCQALELTIDQINYLEQVYKKHNNTHNAELNETKNQEENQFWFFLYPPRFFNTPFSENIKENSYTPVEPLTIEELIETHYSKNKEILKNKNNPTSFRKINSFDIFNENFTEREATEIFSEKEATDPSFTEREATEIGTNEKEATEEKHIESKAADTKTVNNNNYQFKLDDEKAFETLLLQDSIKFLFSKDDLTNVIRYDATTFFAGMHNYVNDPIYALFFHERIPLSFEAWYSTDYTNNIDYYKPLVNNTMSCMNALLGETETTSYINESDFTIDWKSIPDILNSFNKSSKYYHFCKNYLSLSMFFIYKSIGYTNLEKIKFLFSPKGTYPHGNIFSNTSYLLRDAIMIDRSWQTILLFLRLLTLQKGIADYNNMKYRNFNSINIALEAWDKKNTPLTIINRFNFQWSQYPSIILEKSLSNEALNKILDVEFLMHHQTFFELDQFELNESGTSLVEKMNEFIGKWTKYGYDRTLKAMNSQTHHNSPSNRNINFINWSRQIIGMLRSTLNRYLEQRYIQNLIEAHKIAPQVYRVPNSIQLAVDSLSKLEDEDWNTVLLSTVVEDSPVQLWYPVKINYKSVIDVINEVRFVCNVMSDAIGDDQMENLFSRVIERITFMLDSPSRHPPGMVISEITSFVSPYYSGLPDEARNAELQKSMGAMFLSNMWSFFYKTIIPMINNKNYLLKEENNFKKLKWEEILYDPKSVYSLKKFSSLDEGFMVKLKKFFSNHYVYKKKLKKSILTLSLSYTSTVTGYFYYYLNFKKLGTSLIFFSPYYAEILSTWKKKDFVKGLNMATLALNNQLEKSGDEIKPNAGLDDITLNFTKPSPSDDNVKSLKPLVDLEGDKERDYVDPYITNRLLTNIKEKELNKTKINVPIKRHSLTGRIFSSHMKINSYITRKFKNIWVKGLIKTAILFAATLFSLSALGFELTLLLFLGASGIRWFGRSIAQKNTLTHAREAMPAIN